MSRDWKYIAYLSAAILFYMAYKLFSPRDIDWTITYHHNDKNPFGTYALNTFISYIFPDDSVNRSHYTIYELYDTLSHPANFISFSTRFEAGEEDVKALLKNVEQGGTAFIAAQYFTGPLADTLSLFTSDYFFESFSSAINRNDTSQLQFVNPLLTENPEYHFPRKNIHNYFSDVDSIATAVTINDLGLPVTLKIIRGKGAIYVNSTPLAFSNAYLLNDANYKFAELSLSHLPQRTTYWTEYYHLGRMEAQTPLRFILGNEPLRWAYYITVFSLILFMLFEIKRRQRVIPIIKPLVNTSLEFVQTVGNLYYQSADHKNIAEKRIQFFLEQLVFNYNINPHSISNKSFEEIANKTGRQLQEVQDLFNDLEAISNKDQITAEVLTELTKKLDSFKHSS